MKTTNLKNTLVTGGLGFIGSNLIEHLIPISKQVIVIDDFSSGSKDNIKYLLPNDKIIIKKISVLDYSKLSKIFNQYNIENVFHLAAITSVKESLADPIYTNKVNVEGTLNILQLSNEHSIEKFIFSSSASVYGDNQNIPLIETNIPTPISPYAITKLAGEFYSKIYHEIHDLKTVILRYFNVHGPNQNPNNPYSGVISKFIHAAINNKPLIIYGDGNQIRDFVYVSDVSKANIMSALSNNCNGKTINIGCGERITINTLANIIIELTSSKSEIHYKETRHGDIYSSLADVSNAKETLNFSTKVNLEEGLKNTIDWYKKNEIR